MIDSFASSESPAESSIEDLPPWYALRVKSNFGNVSAVALQDRGYETFYPTLAVQRRWSDRLKEVEAALFPGYLFCRVDLRNRLPVLTAPGIVQIIGQGKKPIPVPDSEIEAVRTVLKAKVACEPWPSIPVGQQVRVEKGPLSGLEGVLTEVKRRYRLLISVHLLQRSVAVEVDAAWVRPITSPGPVAHTCGWTTSACVSQAIRNVPSMPSM